MSTVSAAAIAELPISLRRADIVAALLGNQVLVIAGETGSGKTTQLPKFCLEAGLADRGRIGCTQPRRVAALSVSRRVAEELGVTWGRDVGCKMRFNDDTGRDTRVKFMTDGILLAEIQSDPLLRSYSTLIIDEAHERSLNIDFLLGYLQGLLKRRDDLRLVITSATIDTQTFSHAFGGAPIIEVSGRLWPVDVRYAPVTLHARPGESADDLTHVDAAVRATEDALIESDDGDVLIFMPTERDIRDTVGQLEGALGTSTEVIGLFGRMAAGDQQRVFTPGGRRRVIVSTNIAETSLTLPRIRYVIDSGLARMSRYDPRTRTKRLPVEPVAQSSANQRAGRAGRLRDGVCIRLYDEDDFQKRPPFTQPEIQRANLAEVILRMKAFRLGEIETFPFLNPPAAAAIRAGYTLLHELGALDDTHTLTPVGHDLARLPIDPTLGRMLLQARTEQVLPEMLAIAAGLSVPDPRERPEEQKEAAATAHAAFTHPDSDFLTLLNIWIAAPGMETAGSSNALRKFCKTNFLSLTRMREWRDVHRHLTEAMDPEHGDGEPAPALDPDQISYAGIHRAILAGSLGQIAQRTERNSYKAAGARVATLFPGSGLYERTPKRRKEPAPGDERAPEKPGQPLWIVAGELVETSQLFARTVAGVDPEWIAELGAHLCHVRHTEPHWSPKAGRVLVLERVLLRGLELTRRHVDFGRIDPVLATELFIRGALMEEEVRAPLPFLDANRAVLEKLENTLTRVRSRRALDLEESLYRFYATRLEGTGISSVHDLNRFLREKAGGNSTYLCVTENDLLDDQEELAYDRALFPDQIPFGTTALLVTYRYNPGEESDGVTVRVPLPVATQLTAGQLQWMVPGLREETAGVLLRALPKSIRKLLLPLEPKIQEVAAEFQPGREPFFAALAAFLSHRYKVQITAADWPAQSLPAHLQPRVELIATGGKVVAASRDLADIHAHAAASGKAGRSAAWERAAQRREQRGLTAWTFGSLPESLVVEEVEGVPLHGWPGLVAGESSVDIKLFRTREEAEAASRAGIRRLGELLLARDLARVWKDLAALEKSLTGTNRPAPSYQAALSTLGAQMQITTVKPAGSGAELLRQSAYRHLLHHLLALHPVLPLAETRFVAMLETARREFPGRTHKLCETIQQVLATRRTVLASKKRYRGMEDDVRRLAGDDFPAHTPAAQMVHLPRYLRAIQIRAERADLHPAKDAEKAKQLLPFADWESRVPATDHETFRWMLEEFRVSVFAQELGTAHPVSAARLKAMGKF